MEIILTSYCLKKVWSASRKEWYLSNEKVYDFVKIKKNILQEYNYVIYALINPLDNNIFYIGSTNDVNNRYQSHLKCKVNKEKNNQINYLINNKIIPGIIVLEGFEDKKLARLVEKSYIKFYKKLNKNLTNIKLT